MDSQPRPLRCSPGACLMSLLPEQLTVWVGGLLGTLKQREAENASEHLFWHQILAHSQSLYLCVD